MNVKLVCQTCQKEYPSHEPVWRCECGGFLSIDFHARFPQNVIQKRKNTLWRYREALPIIHDEHIVSFDEGYTPLLKEQILGRNVLLKLDYLFPSGSYKDRGASVLVSKIKELGVQRVVEDSSGNAGAAIAAYCAKAGITCDVYVPEKTTQKKLLQIERYGAHLHKIHGSREDTANAAWSATKTRYYASHYWNPFFFHGTKTFIFEVVEQLGWNAPDIVILPIGNGTLLMGTYIGLKELHREGIIQNLPKIIGVQAQNCAPIASAWIKKLNTIKTVKTKKTIAEGIAVASPVRGKDILRIIQETKGTILSVSEQEIKNAFQEITQKGYYIEPTAAAAIAGFKKYPMKKNKTVIIPLTGHGIKASDTFL
ncbi:MAG: threonine synthase [Methanobacteriota archaeon]